MRTITLLIVIIGFLAVYASRPNVESGVLQVNEPPTVPLGSQEPRGEEISEPVVTYTPLKPIQGEPVLVAVTGLVGTTSVSSLTFQNKPVGVFRNGEVYQALVGLDLRLAPGRYPLVATLSDGRVVRENLVVGKREITSAPLGIPDSLGGNTPQSEQELLNTLVQEGKIIDAIKTSDSKLWEGEFRLPLNGEIFITDEYGYNRETGSSNISHKGTDFRAKVGTEVLAMNSGKVAYKGYLRNYGNVVALDHGLGLLTIYMHLDQVLVNVGDEVEKGERIARSGATGYVLGPHLHLTVRINNISIDPEAFLKLMGS